MDFALDQYKGPWSMVTRCVMWCRTYSMDLRPRSSLQQVLPSSSLFRSFILSRPCTLHTSHALHTLQVLFVPSIHSLSRKRSPSAHQ